jgi:hypothetical protein
MRFTFGSVDFLKAEETPIDFKARESSNFANPQ